MEALEKYGVGRGLMMGLKRFGKCHPWGGFGFDPVK
jgi:putative component of membrane protein insertase Oxa1/YidC/SpoIIIJ protein YidD